MKRERELHIHIDGSLILHRVNSNGADLLG